MVSFHPEAKKQESSWVAYCRREGKTTIMTRERFEMQKIGRGSKERGGGSVKHFYRGVLVLAIIAYKLMIVRYLKATTRAMLPRA